MPEEARSRYVPSAIGSPASGPIRDLADTVVSAWIGKLVLVVECHGCSLRCLDTAGAEFGASTCPVTRGAEPAEEDG